MPKKRRGKAKWSEDQRAQIAMIDDLTVFALTIWAEAASEPFVGKQAVARSILNRVAFQTWYGKSIREVCLMPYQYSCWNANQPTLPRMLSVTNKNQAFARCIDIAKMAMDGTLPDNIEGATHYFADYIAEPKWAKKATFVTQLGVHKFYKEVP